MPIRRTQAFRKSDNSFMKQKPPRPSRNREVTIRLMTSDDYDNVLALWVNTAGIGLNPVDDSRDGIEKYLRRNPATCFVAEKAGTLIGVILSGHDGRRGYIHHAAVSETVRQQGVGQALVDAALGALKTEGIRKVACVVFTTNEAGNRFWEKLGFETRTDLNYRNKMIAA